MASAPITRRWIALTAIGLLSATGCSTLGLRDPLGGSAGNSLIPTRHQVQVGAFRVSSNVPMAEDDPALVALADLEDRVGKVLGVRVPEGSAPIDIYILDDEHAFTTYLMFHHPELPSRRAFFLAVGEQAEVYTARGEFLEEDLRHEATHALLHRSIGHMPLWLDEGLAEYFEVESHALPAEAVARFRRLAESYRRGWRPDLERLETLNHVAGMSSTDYREAWAWSLLMLHGPNRGALMTHLERLRIDGEDAPLLSDAWRGELPQLNRQFLAQVTPKFAPESPSLTRLQSPSSPPAPRTAPPVRRIEPARVMPSPVVVEPAPRGPIGRIGQGIGKFFDRIIP